MVLSRRVGTRECNRAMQAIFTELIIKATYVEDSQSLVTGTLHRWSFTLPYSADLLFVHLYHTIAAIDGWKMIKADQAGRLIRISPVVRDVPSDKDGSVLSIRALYRADEKSKMELVLQTSKSIEYKEAFSSYPIETIIHLNGKGLNKTLVDAFNSLSGPIGKTVAWHLKAKGMDIQDINPSELESKLRARGSGCRHDSRVDVRG